MDVVRPRLLPAPTWDIKRDLPGEAQEKAEKEAEEKKRAKEKRRTAKKMACQAEKAEEEKRRAEAKVRFLCKKTAYAACINVILKARTEEKNRKRPSRAKQPLPLPPPSLPRSQKLVSRLPSLSDHLASKKNAEKEVRLSQQESTLLP